MTIVAAPFSTMTPFWQPRSIGAVRMSAKRVAERSVLGDFRQSGSLKMLFPRVATIDLQAVLVNTAGGITGGDRFALHATAGAGTRVTLTTQAAERAYRALAGEVGRIENRLALHEGARIDWVPQETILFDGCAVARSLTIEMAETARLLMVEPLVFGRTARGEKLGQAEFRDRIEIRRSGEVHFLDAMHLTGDVTAHLHRAAIADGAKAMVVLLYIAPDAEAHLASVRALLPDSAGASLIAEDTLVLRALAADSFELRRFLIPILQRLSGAPLPRPWMI